MYVDDVHCRVVMMTHLHVYPCHVALSMMKSVAEAPWRALMISHVPWHYDVVALPKRRKSVDDDPHGVLGSDDHV